MKQPLKKAKKGFTLAEMLIALALIGIIAAMLIPKILQSSGQRTDVAKARNLMSLVERAYYESAQDPEGPSQNQSFYNFIKPRVNGTATAAGAAAGDCPATDSAGGFTFADGTAVAFYETGTPDNVKTAGEVEICFDLKANNGSVDATGFTPDGDDRFWGSYNYTSPTTPVKFNWAAAGSRDPSVTVSAITNQ